MRGGVLRVQRVKCTRGWRQEIRGVAGGTRNPKEGVGEVHQVFPFLLALRSTAGGGRRKGCRRGGRLGNEAGNMALVLS